MSTTPTIFCEKCENVMEHLGDFQQNEVTPPLKWGEKPKVERIQKGVTMWCQRCKKSKDVITHD